MTLRPPTRKLLFESNLYNSNTNIKTILRFDCNKDRQWRSFHWGNEATASLDFFCRTFFNVINIIKVD